MSDALLASVAAAAAMPAAAALASAAAPVAPLTLDRLRSEHPALAAALLAEGASAERARIEGIRSAMFAGQDALAAQMIADGRTTPGEAALKFNADHKAKSPDQLAALAAADKHVRIPANGGALAGPAAGEQQRTEVPQNEAGWRAEWAGSAALQREFVRADDYVALMKSETGRTARSISRPAAA